MLFFLLIILFSLLFQLFVSHGTVPSAFGQAIVIIPLVKVKNTNGNIAHNSNQKAVLPQGNRAMPHVFFSVEVRQQHSLQV